ncbi:hypothetical protein CBL_09144 [Carabus blaptoides fortunei]
MSRKKFLYYIYHYQTIILCNENAGNVVRFNATELLPAEIFPFDSLSVPIERLPPENIFSFLKLQINLKLVQLLINGDKKKKKQQRPRICSGIFNGLRFALVHKNGNTCCDLELASKWDGRKKTSDHQNSHVDGLAVQVTKVDNSFRYRQES